MAGLLIPTVSMSDPVADVLRRWASEPFEACALSVLDYVEQVCERRLDPRPVVRGKVAVARLMRSPARFEALCADAMGKLGCPMTDEAQRGDVGLVEMAGSGMTAAIYLGALWGARGDRQVVIEAAAPIRAWRVSCRKR